MFLKIFTTIITFSAQDWVHIHVTLFISDIQGVMQRQKGVLKVGNENPCSKIFCWAANQFIMNINSLKDLKIWAVFGQRTLM